MKNQSEDLIDRYKGWMLFKRILFYIKPYTGLVALAIGLLLTVSILNLAGPYLTKIVIDDHITARDMSGLDMIAVIYLTVLVCSFLFQFCQTYVMQYIGQKVMFDLRSKVFAHTGTVKCDQKISEISFGNIFRPSKKINQFSY